MEPKIIENENEYFEMKAQLSSLMDRDALPGTADYNQLNLLATLIDKYEKEKFTFKKPSPIEFILFRMNERNLKQSDLVPIIGSKSKVSEVLSGKVALSLPMIKNLIRDLNIPAEILLETNQNERTDFDKSLFPIKEMLSRKYFEVDEKSENKIQISLKNFFGTSDLSAIGNAAWRKSSKMTSEDPSVLNSLCVWKTFVKKQSEKLPVYKSYKKEIVDDNFLKDVARLSRYENGPLLAKDFLEKNGITLIIEKHFSKTKLDGAAMVNKFNAPVIGLTLRYDRLDYFWFTLMHELIHVKNHLFKSSYQIFFDTIKFDEEVTDLLEKETNDLVDEIFVPFRTWKNSSAFRSRSREGIVNLAQVQQIHPAIVAGRLRYETKKYENFSDLIGNGRVRKLFNSSVGTI